MPVVRLTVFKSYTLLTSSITFNGEIINPYSCCAKKGLVCIAIVNPFNYQSFSCSECIKLNTYILYNVRSVPLNKYMFFIYLNSY